MTTPLPPQAVAAQVPGDLGAERLSLLVAEVSEALKPHFGPLASAVYRLPANTRWADITQFYGEAFKGRMRPVDGVYREGRRHRLAVWSAGSDEQMMAVAFVETPVSGQVATHTVLVLLTPMPR